MSSIQVTPDLSTLIRSSTFFKHAVATPLSSLLLSLELLQLELEAKNTQQTSSLALDRVKTARWSSHRLNTLLFHLEDEIQTSHRFPVYRAVQEVVNSIKTLHPDVVVRLRKEVESDFMLAGSEFLFEEALLCLITNGFEAYQASASLKMIEIQLQEHDGCCQVSILDGGCGMDEQKQSEYLKLGESTKKYHSGIGLPTITQIVQTHFGGTVEILSTPNLGTCVQLHIPI